MLTEMTPVLTEMTPVLTEMTSVLTEMTPYLCVSPVDFINCSSFSRSSRGS